MEFYEGVYLFYLLFEDVRKCFFFNNMKKIFYLIIFVEEYYSLVCFEKKIYLVNEKNINCLK